MPRTTCYHVNATNDLTYGVAAGSVTEAKTLLQQRLDTEDPDHRPIKAKSVGTWDAAYGTVLCYGDTERCGGALEPRRRR